MTHWMTAAGLALIAGGLAVLIGFRHVLLVRGGNRTAGARRRSRTPRAIEPPRRAQLSASAAPLPDAPGRTAERPARPAVPARSAVSSRAVDGPARSAVSSRAVDGPVRPAVSSRAGDGPARSTVPSRPADGPTVPSRPADGPIVPSRAADDPTPQGVPLRAADGPARPAVPSQAAEVPGPRRRRILVASRAGEDRPRVEAGPADADADRQGPAPVRRPQGGLALLGLADEEEISGEVIAGAADEPSGEVFAEGEPLVQGAVADKQVGDKQVDERVGEPVDEPVDEHGDNAPGEQPAEEIADEPVAERGIEPAHEGGVEPAHARGVEPAHAGGVEPAHASRAGELAAERVAEVAEERGEDVADDGAQVQPIAKAESVASVAGGNEPGSGADTRFGTVAAPAGGMAPRVDRYGDRVDGWVRPEYREQYEPGGEYWTPVPESSYADAGYGWPVPVERLPPVPSYPPHSGFDPEPVDEPEPTAVVPQWPPAKPSERTDPLRTWTDRNTRSPRVEAVLDWVARDRTPAVRDEAALDWVARDRNPEGRSRRGAVMIDRRSPGGSAETEMLPAVNETAPRRRPRPRPSPPDQQSTVYRSRHAAEPG